MGENSYILIKSYISPGFHMLEPERNEYFTYVFCDEEMEEDLYEDVDEDLSKL